MVRRLLLAGAALSALAGCSFAPTDKVIEALAQDHNPVSVDVTFTTPWGTEHMIVQRNVCTPAQPLGAATPLAQVK